MQRQGGVEHQNISDWDNQNPYLNESILQILDEVSILTSKANVLEINSNNETRGANIQLNDFISSSRYWVVYVLTPICFIVGVLCNAENRVTITVIALGVLYFICQLPTNLLIAYKLVYKPTARSPGEMILLELRSIFNLLSGINSTCTVLLFIALNQNYRKYFCGICYRRRPTNFYANAFRSPRVGLRVGLHAADGAIELNNIVDGRY
ncbi:unnamed protein product [Orchesella dallaii]|uniref:Uncharacterized protein n=1 Tax=Orchesella dallaii TaxID=48710 RepID=A0ABP1RW82_9HEXA